MAKLHPAKLAALLAIAVVAVVGLACSGGGEEDSAAVKVPGSEAGQGLSATLYASPT